MGGKGGKREKERKGRNRIGGHFGEGGGNTQE